MTLSRSSIALLAFVSMPVLSAEWVTTLNTDQHGATGSITFNDWNYTGPTGVGANDFVVGSGFDSTRIGQIQTVVTTSPDWRTSDALDTVTTDFGAVGYTTPTTLPNANMDGQVNFFDWAYTTPAGSTFSNMQIDKAGNYFVAQSDMNFGFYDVFEYNNGSTIQTIDSGINFQPYAISDARGWCGSVLVPDPNSVAQMGGQVSFDFAFDVYLSDGNLGDSHSTQIVPDFIMRSYGEYVVNATTAYGWNQYFTGSAVMNNTNPETGELDPAFQNKVSFLGAGIVPRGAWVLNDGTPDVQVVEEGTPGATWHPNSFGGYAFLLRADAERTLEFIALDGHSDYVSTVPVPAAGWLLGSGMLGLFGAARRRAAG